MGNPRKTKMQGSTGEQHSAGIQEATAKMLCEMPVDLRCKIDSSLPLALVLRNSESCRAFCQAMRDDSLWELLLRRDFPHFVPSEASSGSWCTEYQHQLVKHTRTDDNIRPAVDACCNDPVSGEQQYGHISDWIVDQVTDMSELFCDKSDFNENISKWNVGQVKTMKSMFKGARSFNQDIGQWNVGQVKTMKSMFKGVSSFNQDIGQWNVGQVKTMNCMFMCASSFNQDIGQWNVGQVENVVSMFHGASSFDQDIGQWNVGQVERMSCMFQDASSFNQDIGQWNVGQVKDMNWMFEGANSLEQMPQWYN